MSHPRRSLLTPLAVIAMVAWVSALIAQPVSAAGTADLSVAMVGDARTLKFGKTMTFTVTASNLGPAVATGVAVTLGTSDSFANFGGTCPDGSVSSYCDIGELVPGASVTLEFRVMAANACCPEHIGVAVASVIHDADTIDLVPANDSVRSEVRLKGKAPL